MDEFNAVTKKPYKDQAIFYLNAYWPEEFDKSEDAREAVYKAWHQFIEIDKLQWEEVNKKVWKQGWSEGNSLDELFSHKYLEKIGRTLTVVAFRGEFRKIDVNFDKRMAMLEYLLFEHKHSVADVMDKPQGDNSKELEEAQAALQQVQQALTELQEKNERQKVLVAQQLAAQQASTEAAVRASTAQTKAEAALAAQKVAEAQVRKAEAELAAAVDELVRQEKAPQDAIHALEGKATDPNLSGMKQNLEKNELAQLREKDPLPLRKAKITQGAALKAVERERKQSEAATEKAQHDAQAAEAARKEADQKVVDAQRAREQAEEQARAIEAAVADTIEKFKAAQAYLEEMKKKSGSRQGALWWLSRDLAEAGKYMPKASGNFS